MYIPRRFAATGRKFRFNLPRLLLLRQSRKFELTSEVITEILRFPRFFFQIFELDVREIHSIEIGSWLQNYVRLYRQPRRI